MSDGDIWGGGRLTAKWLAVGAQREVDLARGDSMTAEFYDHTARALAETLRSADRHPCEAVVAAIVANAGADVVTRQNSLERIEREWGSSDAQIACRAAVALLDRLSPSASEAEIRLGYAESYVVYACRHMEDTLNARLGCEGAPSALLPEHAFHLARQIARGPEAKVRAPNRTSPPKDTRSVLDLEVM
jgi:hypothetical protein